MTAIKLTKAQREWLALIENEPQRISYSYAPAVRLRVLGLVTATDVRPFNPLHTITAAGRDWLVAHTRKQ